MKLSKLILPCLLILLPASNAKACDGGNLAMAFLFGYNNQNFRTGVINNFTPPYFALHPPVYYGDRFYRPYGASPFAAWPQLQPNANYAPRMGLGVSAAPMMMDNPHCHPISPEVVSPQVPDVVSENSSRYSGPLIIDNPFFVEEQTRLTSLTPK